MFDILSADIVVFQETKIQRKDLTDDMVLVPGWDCYFSLPRHKKGYSGVVIYTRQSVCCPIRAEEGITGVLCPPNSSTSFRDLPIDQQIGGYPSPSQLSNAALDATTLDSEGRCVILEFPAFVLLGVYSPANRDESRDDFRLGFLELLDTRVRNLISMGKRVFLTGDLNISREELDAANAEAAMRKQGLTGLEYVSTPARRLFNQLLEGGKVFGERDEGREAPVMWDICRAFNPGRKGMFTCWEQKVNARPANCGARIDYVLCSLEMKTWFSDSNIQEGLMGSDHCPVYAILEDKVPFDGIEHHLLDVMNPQGMFSDGERQREYNSAADPLPMSGRLIPEFFGRRNIRDMFARKPSVPKTTESDNTNPFRAQKPLDSQGNGNGAPAKLPQSESPQKELNTSPSSEISKKRGLPDSQTNRSLKRTKSNVVPQSPPANGKGQQSLKGFFKPKATATTPAKAAVETVDLQPSRSTGSASPVKGDRPEESPGVTARESQETRASFDGTTDINSFGSVTATTDIGDSNDNKATDASVHDPIESKESWSKLFTKPRAPRCESHDEPCVTLLTKKPGMNLGRSFWMCPRPLGPSGAKETNTQWRCHTFIWCSDWNSNTRGNT